MNRIVTEPKQRFITIADTLEFRDYLLNVKCLKPKSVHAYMTIVTLLYKNNADLYNVDDYNSVILKHCIRANNLTFGIRAFIDFIFSKPSELEFRTDLKSKLIKKKNAKDYLVERKSLTEDQIFSVISSMRHPINQMIAIMMFYTGMRFHDVLNIKTVNGLQIVLDSDNNRTLKVTTSGKGSKRYVSFIYDQDVIDLIVEFTSTFELNVPGFVFAYLSRSEMCRNDPHYMERMMNDEVLREGNIKSVFISDLNRGLVANGFNKGDFTAHSFRHAYARKVWNATKDVHTLQKMLNHSAASTSMSYLAKTQMDNIELGKRIHDFYEHKLSKQIQPEMNIIHQGEEKSSDTH